jgi:hypothetical protein
MDYLVYTIKPHIDFIKELKGLRNSVRIPEGPYRI